MASVHKPLRRLGNGVGAPYWDGISGVSFVWQLASRSTGSRAGNALVSGATAMRSSSYWRLRAYAIRRDLFAHSPELDVSEMLV